MAVIEVKCVGITWQDDFAPLVPRLYTYFNQCFYGEKNYEELRHKAVLQVMLRFSRKWKRKRTVRLATSFIVWHVRNGLDIVHKPNRHHRSVKPVRMTGRVLRRAGRRENLAEHLDIKAMLASLEPVERAMLESLRAGMSWREVREALGVTDYRIRQALDKAKDYLSR